MMAKHLLVLTSVLTMAACGGGTLPPDGPEGQGLDGDVPSADGAGDATPDDGIVRDADGDGVPDDSGAAACEGKTETQCKINSNCAWSDQSTCVAASDSPM
ncbi:MAG: hypothetical protein JRI68_26990 [Deltaproteobacteria bacterium]|nr:hypothetical protein [Deltaproteobacteria bacterium]